MVDDGHSDDDAWGQRSGGLPVWYLGIKEEMWRCHDFKMLVYGFRKCGSLAWKIKHLPFVISYYLALWNLQCCVLKALPFFITMGNKGSNFGWNESKGNHFIMLKGLLMCYWCSYWQYMLKCRISFFGSRLSFGQAPSFFVAFVQSLMQVGKPLEGLRTRFYR